MKNLGRNQVASTCVTFLLLAVSWLKPPASFKPRCYDQLLGWKCLVKMTVKIGVEGVSKMVEELDRYYAIYIYKYVI